MKHTVVRSEPAPPPVEKIVLELTPGEFLAVWRIVGLASCGLANSKLTFEKLVHDVYAASGDRLFDALSAAALDVGLHR